VGRAEVEISKPLSPAEVRDEVYGAVQPHDIIQAVLQQELALYCGKLTVTNPALFEGILNIRVGWVLQAIQLYMDIESAVGSNHHDVGGVVTPKLLGFYSPSNVRRPLYTILMVNQNGTGTEKGTK